MPRDVAVPTWELFSTSYSGGIRQMWTSTWSGRDLSRQPEARDITDTSVGVV